MECNFSYVGDFKKVWAAWAFDFESPTIQDVFRTDLTNRSSFAVFVDDQNKKKNSKGNFFIKKSGNKYIDIYKRNDAETVTAGANFLLSSTNRRYFGSTH